MCSIRLRVCVFVIFFCKIGHFPVRVQLFFGPDAEKLGNTLYFAKIIDIFSYKVRFRLCKTPIMKGRKVDPDSKRTMSNGAILSMSFPIQDPGSRRMDRKR